jgi:DNA invertase Pin-like site-specific DNA recombinase
MSKSKRVPDIVKSGAAEPLPEAASSCRLVPFRSTKIQQRHLERLAIVYVRQSTPHQVQNHRESRERQYALADHAVALGWARARVIIIDEDTGNSGKTAEGRDGFHRLLAEVTMDHVGLVLGLEMSRIARSNKDWHHLLEICAVFSTVLADQDGVYDPRDCNDRLLLGLKGTMSEFELVTMRNRLQRGQQNKAERGELYFSVPFGYVKLANGLATQDPDEQVRAVVGLIFAKLEELGSSRAVFRYLIGNNVRIGIRARGELRGQLEWRRPTPITLWRMFHHPIYAGAYAYGREPRDPKCDTVGQGDEALLENWKVLKRDHLPAYISWDRFLANLRRLRQNQAASETVGSTGRGGALLSGLIRCGNCGRRLQTQYRHAGNGYYGCTFHLRMGTEQKCYGVAAKVVDELVAEQVLRALEPAALQLSLQATQDIHKERERLDLNRRQQLERARYEVERARRQYDAVEPENRLVARTLEQGWEEALCRQRHLEEDYDRFAREQPAEVTEAEQAQILALSTDLPALWQAPGTMPIDRKEIVRCVVERVVVAVRRDSEIVGVTIHWKGGSTTQHQAVRPVRQYRQMENYPQLLARLVQLRQQGYTAAAIAKQLNQEGYRTPKTREKYRPLLVRKLLSRQGLANEKTSPEQLGQHEWWLADLAREIAVTPEKLADWARSGWVAGRKTPAQGLWVLWADHKELKRLRRLAASSQPGAYRHPETLKTPRKPKK